MAETDLIDGRPVVVVDRYDCLAPDVSELKYLITQLDDVCPPDEMDAWPQYLFINPEHPQAFFTPREIVGIVHFHDRLMSLQTHLNGHGNRLRGLIEQSLGDQVRHRERTVEDPNELFLSDPEDGYC